MSHIPGPWTYEHDEDKPFTPEQVFAGKKLIAQVIGDSAETEANARLIAAAPDLLAELIAYHDRDWSIAHEGLPAHMGGDLPDQCSGCAAIAKAEGES